MTGTTKTQCWSIVRKDGVVLLGTSLDRNLVVTASGYAGTYLAQLGISAAAVKSAGDMSVDNTEAVSALATFGVAPADVEAGLFDNVAVVIFETDYLNPSSVTVLRSGTLGQITRDSDGKYTAEVRGLAQALQQTTINTYQRTCRAELGSGAEVPVIRRCGVDISLYTFTGAVQSVSIADRVFTDATLTQAAGYFTFGYVTWTSGDNTRFVRKVKRHQAGGIIELVEQLPADIQIGDAYEITAGDDKSFATCRDKFNNAINFHGEPFIPGADALIAGVTT